jgi:hypothetical protein
MTTSRLGGIMVAWLRMTFPDGTSVAYTNVEMVHQADGLTVLVGPQELAFVPWTALRLMQWEIADAGVTPPSAPH